MSGERDDVRGEILQLVSTLLRVLTNSRSLVKLDFSPVKRIYPGGLLLLLAYLELTLESFPRRVRAVCPRGSKSAQLLHQFGFGERLGVSMVGNKPRDDDVVNWRFGTGHQVEGQKIVEHLDGFVEMIGSSMPQGLYNALCEAMSNVKHHAYPTGCSVPPELQRWWLFSSCRPPEKGKGGQLYLAFYDIGIGIPETMRLRLDGMRERLAGGWQGLMRDLGLGDGLGQDRDLLRLAIDHERSSTGLHFRGKGLPEMKEFASSTDEGRMTIISGGAQYTYRAQNRQTITYRCRQALGGTLILWNLPLTLKGPVP